MGDRDDEPVSDEERAKVADRLGVGWETLTGLHDFARFLVMALDALVRAEKRARRSEEECERERVRLAGCGTAALGYSGAEVKPGDYAHSASYDDVMRLRARADAAEARLASVYERVRDRAAHHQRQKDAQLTVDAALPHTRAILALRLAVPEAFAPEPTAHKRWCALHTNPERGECDCRVAEPTAGNHSTAGVADNPPADSGSSSEAVLAQYAHDLADAVLAAPVVALTPEQRATWGTCPMCAQPHGSDCLPQNDDEAIHDADGWGCEHPARLAAAPTHARLMACEAVGEDGGR